MRVPKTGERVYVRDLNRPFTVACVYHETQTADLVPTTGTGAAKEDVPWHRLIPFASSHSETTNAAND